MYCYQIRGLGLEQDMDDPKERDHAMIDKTFSVNNGFSETITENKVFRIPKLHKTLYKVRLSIALQIVYLKM